MVIVRRWLSAIPVLAATAALTACGEAPRGGAAPATPAQLAYRAVSRDVMQDYFRRHPTSATDLGIHDYDDMLEDYSAAAQQAEADAARGFRSRLAAIDPAGLNQDEQIDRELLTHALDASLLQLEVVRPWARNPDVYSSGLTNAAYALIKRTFAPPENRMRALTKKMRAMPAALAEARRNLDNPPRVYTEIAIEQLDGNRLFFDTAVPEAFSSVTEAESVAEFTAARKAVMQAFAEYKQWLQTDVLPRSKGEFAYGVDTYRKRLLAEEMIDTPLDELLAQAESDLRRNQAALVDAARQIDPSKAPRAVLAALELDHPPADQLLAVTQRELDALAAFIRDHQLVTIPDGAPPARVKETPPFLRATVSASMDTPGPFETRATEAYYTMTLPNPTWTAADREQFMRQWYRPAITNVSVHEVWPGHYLQFLYLRHQSSDVRKMFGALSNVEGWAHYVEQMMIDEGFHGDDPRYRLAQAQDALLRDARFIVGIRMHTKGMSMADAEAFFEQEAFQGAPIARSETKRGTSDATYGYYTMGKLAIITLRDDVKAQKGAAFSLRDFHDAFIRIGPLPIPLVRRVMLGDGR